MKPCDGCTPDTIRERNRTFNDLLTTAKKQAIEENKTKAICQDEISGYFIASAETAIREHFQIKQFVSAIE